MNSKLTWVKEARSFSSKSTIRPQNTCSWANNSSSNSSNRCYRISKYNNRHIVESRVMAQLHINHSLQLNKIGSLHNLNYPLVPSSKTTEAASIIMKSIKVISPRNQTDKKIRFRSHKWQQIQGTMEECNPNRRLWSIDLFSRKLWRSRLQIKFNSSVRLCQGIV